MVILCTDGDVRLIFVHHNKPSSDFTRNVASLYNGEATSSSCGRFKTAPDAACIDEVEPTTACVQRGNFNMHRVGHGPPDGAVRDVRRTLRARPEHPTSHRNLQILTKPDPRSGRSR